MSFSSLRHLGGPRSTTTSSRESQPQLRVQWVSEPSNISIQDLDNDSLLHIFYLFRCSIFSVTESGGIRWDGRYERWWHKFAQVCRRWRYLILGSAFYLRLCLVCTPGTPVANMLAHSPSFPLVISYNHSNQDLTTEDVEGIVLALLHRDRVRRISLQLPVTNLQKLILAMDGEFPELEFLYIGPPTKHDVRLTLPPTFEAPHLRYLGLTHFTSPIGFPLLSTAIRLVILSLEWIHPSTCIHPKTFLQQLSLMPYLEKLFISFRSPIPNRDIERQLLRTPVKIHVTHPNLRVLYVAGVSTFLEAILSRMNAPLLERLTVQFFSQLNFSVPRLSQFMMTIGKLRFGGARFLFHHQAVAIFLRPHADALLNNVDLTVSSDHLDWQVSSMAQICTVLMPLFSTVVDLALDYREHTLSSEWHNQANSTHWRQLFGSFRNVKTLRVHNSLVGEVARALRSDGEPHSEVLPELKELICPVGSVDDKTFAPFIRGRKVTGRPVNIIGMTFPVGRSRYTFFSSTGISYVEPDRDSLS